MRNSDEKYRVLIVDDEEDLREIFRESLEEQGFEVFEASSGNEAIQFIKSERVNGIITDVRMPDGTGLDFLEYIQNISANDMIILLMTGFSDIHPEDAYDKGASALLKKPVDPDIIIQSLKQLERLKTHSRKIRPPRYASAHAARIRPMGGEYSECQLVNISRGGFLASIEKLQLEMNSEVEFEIQANPQIVVCGKAYIRRLVYPTKVQPKSQFGVEFQDLSEPAKKDLQFLLRQLEDNVLPIL